MDVGQLHEAPGRDRLGLDPEDITKGAEGIRHSEEEVAVLVVGTADDDLPLREQDLHLLDRLMRQAVFER